MADDIEAKVIEIVAEQMGRDQSEITRETSFVNDLNADSLDTVELVMEFEDQFELSIPDEDAEKIQTVGQAIDFINEHIAQAKSELVQALPPDGVAILNYDDRLVRGMAEMTRARVMYYGLSPKADLWASHIQGRGLEGIHFRLHYGGETLHLRVPLLGRHSVHTALRAAAVGLVEGESWQEIVEGLQCGSPQLRLVAVEGVKDCTVLDDTYNASPQSTLAALTLLDELEGRKIAVLGDMLELGTYEVEGHRKVGLRVIDSVDVLITVGELAKIIAREARRWGMEADAVHMLDSNDQVIALLQDIIEQKDVILVKGSRAMHMEEIVMALARPSWKDSP